jgi:uroporphyrinogen-III synthase
VRGWAGLGLRTDWPAGTAIAAVGASSLELVRRSLPGAGRARFIAPVQGEATARDAETGATSGSEALWPLLCTLQPPPRRVLIVRAETGREWLAQRLRQSGAEVEYASVYRRVEHQPDSGARAALQDWFDRGLEPACLLTSSEAIGALDRQLAERTELRYWLHQGLALYTHERIGKALCEAGYRRVAQCEPSVESVRAVIAVRRPAAEGVR